MNFKVGDKVVRKAGSPCEYFGEKSYYVVKAVDKEDHRIRVLDDDGDTFLWEPSSFELYKSEGKEPVIEISHLKEVIESLFDLYQSKEKTLDYLGAYIAGNERGYNK